MKILIIDDEPLVRRTLAKGFLSRGHDVVQAEDGEVGLAHWKEFDPDIVFLDMIMPIKTGPQVLAEIGFPRKAYVILMTAYTQNQENLLQRFKVDEFLLKPFEDIFKVLDHIEGIKK